MAQAIGLHVIALIMVTGVVDNTLLPVPSLRFYRMDY